MNSDRRQDRATAATIAEALRMKTAFGIGAAHALAARGAASPRPSQSALCRAGMIRASSLVDR